MLCTHITIAESDARDSFLYDSDAKSALSLSQLYDPLAKALAGHTALQEVLNDWDRCMVSTSVGGAATSPIASGHSYAAARATVIDVELQKAVEYFQKVMRLPWSDQSSCVYSDLACLLAAVCIFWQFDTVCDKLTHSGFLLGTGDTFRAISRCTSSW